MENTERKKKKEKKGRKERGKYEEILPKIFIKNTSGRWKWDRNSTESHLLYSTGFGALSRFSETMYNLLSSRSIFLAKSKKRS